MDSFTFILITVTTIGIAGFLVLRWGRTYPQVLLLMMPLAYDMVTVNASVLFLDSNKIFISETSTVSHETGAAVRLLLFNILIVVGVAIGMSIWSALFGRLGATVTPPPEDVCRRMLWLMLAVIGISLANVLLSHGVPYPGSGFDRQSFWEFRLRFPIIRDVFGILLLFVPFVCAAVELYGRRLREKSLTTFARIVLVLYFLFLLIGGQVFHGLLFPSTIVVAFFIAPTIYGRTKLLVINRLPLLVAGAIAMVATVYLSFQNRGISASFVSAWDAIIYRVVALQGSAYWQSDFLWGLGGATGSLDTLLHGREFLILSIMPPSLAEGYLRDGVNLQGALPGTSLLSIGLVPTVLLCIGYGILVGFVTSLVYSMVINGRVILLLPTSYLWLWTITVYSRASLESIFDKKFLLFSVIVAGSSLVYMHGRRTRSSSDPFIDTRLQKPKAPPRRNTARPGTRPASRPSRSSVVKV